MSLNLMYTPLETIFGATMERESRNKQLTCLVMNFRRLCGVMMMGIIMKTGIYSTTIRMRRLSRAV